jgi:squalene-hopene/tetraprenyl-beta-curcumene cyclase
VTTSHPYFGGAGYNDSKWGRPDLSNTSIMLAALYDSGVDSNDVVFQQAVTFVERLQGIEENEMYGDLIVQNGGIIYSPAVTKDYFGLPESKANAELVKRARAGESLEELKAELEDSEKLRPYGSMSYAGYMSYLYAKLAPNDYRVRAVKDYLINHYTVEENPAMGQKSYYFYTMMFGRAWKASGDTVVTLPNGEKRDWANDLIDELAERQQEDGSWTNAANDWMEGDANLATAYALIAMQCALGR